MTGRAGYSREHYRRLSNGGPETPEQVAARLAWYRVCEQACAEMTERFGPLTPENALAADEWRRARVKELTALDGRTPLVTLAQ